LGHVSAGKLSPDLAAEENQDSHKQPKFSTMQPLNCMYFEYVHSVDGSTPLVLDCDEVGCGLEEFVWDDKDQMFWWEAEGAQEWGKIVMFNKEWDKTKPQFLTFDAASHDLKLTDVKKDAVDFFYEMRDSTLLAKNNAGVIEKVAADKMKKWADVKVFPLKDSLAEPNKDAFWHINYCYWENKPNPETANEKIPQTTMMKHFPDNWHKTGEFDYDESKYNTFLYPDPRCPYETGKLFTYVDDPSEAGNEYTLMPDMTWCPYMPNAFSDATRGDVHHVDHYHDWCWMAFGWEISPGISLLDSFRLHIWAKWTGVDRPWGGVWARRRWTEEEWLACPRGEWCEIDVAIEGMDWNKWGY
jgi:hypothetical protein